MAEEILVASGVAALVVSAIAVAAGIKGVRDQLWLHTFSEYTRRFEDAICALPGEARRANTTFDPTKLSPEERSEVENSTRKYLNLCSEEHYLFARGRIDERTWQIWTTGMEDMFRLPWFSRMWDEMRPEYIFYSDFCDFFDACRSSASATGEVSAAQSA